MYWCCSKDIAISCSRLVQEAGELGLPLCTVPHQGSLQLRAIDLDEVDGVRGFFLHNVRLKLTISGGSTKKQRHVRLENPDYTESRLGLLVSLRRTLQMYHIATVAVERTCFHGIE